MCWTKINNVEILTAEKDIRVFKIVGKTKGGILRPYYTYNNHVYLIKEENSFIPIEIDSCNEYGKKCNKWGKETPLYYYIDEGYHSYMAESIPEVEHMGYFIKVFYKTAFSNLGVYNTFGFVDFSSLCLVECTIPKGTRYCVNSNGECVSERIIIDKILEEYEYRL